MPAAPKPFGGAAVPLEVPPSEDRSKCSKCINPIFSKGLCRSHYYKDYRAKDGAKPSPETKAEKKKSEAITEEAVEGMVVAGMQLLATTLDESFSALDVKLNADGSVSSVAVKPHVKESVRQMMPWMEIYGDSFIAYLPWFGLVGGVFGLVAPAFDPACEIIAGIRKPRMARADPRDIYTDKYKAYQARRESERQNAQTGQKKETKTEEPKRAADKTVLASVVPPPDEDLSDSQGKTG